ncbi:MAG TPA: tail fiber protein [Allosphingosinicella sp.]|jgi:microcystin-dependent protein|nr:tail fiber protein [Allosphingosinicella sp.]
MANPFIGEIRIFACSFEVAGWAFCDGRLLPISENDTLFVLLGTTFGGDGEETFALPNLQGRVPVHYGTGSGLSTYTLGEAGGVEEVTLTTQQIPIHSHPLIVSGDQGQLTSPSGNVVGSNPTVLLFRPGAATQTFDPTVMSPVGGSQPHTNIQPYLTLNYQISLFGLFPH